ncbi:PTS sugar transporter subunit IIC [Erysipelothrix sp. HDW6C]|uniref:PTS mannose/fructose/sorbose/N-acetylgalactosamine transporter subunit IIC n=1 Tax=Erysipelothrix sp. HDW6C TaxID=2714930 RepID=UPI00140BA50C|nr:PTS sugar transporter subunit IIC [Erysipelothrix sp. HDW6C]QIK68840.1 PTS sugar transporter subunit IIC [Erysipelothrix sp. HDW6C]
MIIQALIVTLVYYLLYVGDFFIGWQTITRPIVAAPIVGLFLGDLTLGITMGASLEAIFMGISAIGGSIPADALSSSVISVAFAILTGASTEEALAISLPIGTVMAMLNAFMTPVFALAAPVFDKYAEAGNTKAYNRAHILMLLVGMPLTGVITIFLGVAFGIDQLQILLSSLPPFIMSGIGAAAGMLPAVGFAIITSMIWSNQTGMYFFIGFVLAKYLGLGPVPIAIIGTVIALAGFFRDKQLADLKVEATTVSSDEEDFF